MSGLSGNLGFVQQWSRRFPKHPSGFPQHNDGNPTWNYSPTNGTKSIGELLLWGGDAQYIGYRIENEATGKAFLKTLPPVGLLMDNVRYVRRFPVTP